jgi:hypothetical protein
MRATRVITVLAAVALLGVACDDDDATGILGVGGFHR